MNCLRIAVCLALVFAATQAAAQEYLTLGEGVWVRKPSGEEFSENFPHKALKSGKDGKVILDCRVNERGLLESCTVIEETPKEMDFGASALQISKFFAVKPEVMAHRQDVRVRIPVSFVGVGSMGDAGPSTRMHSSVLWGQTPSWAQLLAANPTAKSASPVRGHVGLQCTIGATGGLSNCGTVNSSPQYRGFEEAARKLAGSFKVVDDPAYRKEIVRDYISLSIAFPTANEVDVVRRVARPEWKRLVDPRTAQKLFPPQAAEAGVKSGRGTLECVVAAEGNLDQCKVAAETPAGMGFGQAALEVAKVMQTNLWLDQGEPAIDAQIRVPIVLKLDEERAPSAQ